MAYRKALFLPLVAVAAFAISGCGSSNRETAVQTQSSLSESAACIGCHAAKINENIYAGLSEEEARTIPEEWLISAHNEDNGASCATCHDPDGHPVERGEPARTDLQQIDGTTPVCLECHGPGGDYVPENHFAEDPGTVAQYAATPYPQYFSERDAGKYCTRCHNPHLLHGESVEEIYGQYASSAHADITATPFTEQDFKLNNGGCVRCHTTTGYVRYVESGYTTLNAWGDPSDPSKEVVMCFACHNEYPGELKTEEPVVAMRTLPGDEIPARYVDMSGSAATFPNTTDSNRCYVCHAGRNSGGNIAAAGINDWSAISFASYAPHFRPAAGTLFAKIAYQFPSQTYAGPWEPHVNAGADGVGPCATCHMNNDNHTFNAVQEACVQCHGAENPLTIQPQFEAAVEVLKQQLAAAGFPPLAEYPYFSGVDWGTGITGQNNVGAAFNYWWLNPAKGDPGAFAHSPVYVQQALYDSIDWLDNQTLDQSVQTGAIPALVTAGTITQAQANLALAYFGESGRPGEPTALESAMAKAKAYLKRLLK